MTQEKITLSVRPRGKPINKLPDDITVPANGPSTSLYSALASASGSSVHRLRITKGSDGTYIPSSNSLLLNTTGLRHQSTIYVKDLGPQIAWRTVFLVEYLGPLLIHPLFYTFFTNGEASYLQTLTMVMVMFHFAKRELETLLVHRFSSATMPARNILKNSAHYWVLSGLNMAYWIYQPNAPSAEPSNPLITYAGIAMFVVGELGNLNAHLVLRDLRKPGGTERGVPKGLGFNWVTCPNYLFESIAWIGIALVSWSLSTLVFLAAAVPQMAVWASKKEARYRKEFGATYKRKRYAMLPGIW